jgi:hypothetical protein
MDIQLYLVGLFYLLFGGFFLITTKNSHNLTFLLFILLAAVGFFSLIYYEKYKIRESAEQKGWTIHKILFQIFGGNRNVQYFKVEYMDEFGRLHSCGCKTWLFGKVNWDV